MDSIENKIDQSNLTSEERRLIQETLDAILASTHFKRSKRYPALLEFVVRETLDGRLNDLNERTVATHVFDRQANYDPTTDSVVRMAASEVRKRLALYFSERPDAQVRIELPIGSYAAEFHFRPQAESPLIGTDQPARIAPTPAIERIHGAWRRWVLPIAGLAVILAGLSVWRISVYYADLPVEKFWAPFAKAHATVLISLGESSRKMPASWVDSMPDNAMVKYMQRMSNDPVPDISAANLINQFLASHGGRSEIRMATSTQFSDLRQGPAVLFGAGQASPWTMRLGSNLRYQFAATDQGAVHLILDQNNPANQNWKVDLRLPYDQVSADYALVTRQFNPTTGQWWVGIGGSTTLSTPEAAHMLFDRVAMKNLEAQLPRGWEKKNLQFVVQFTLLNGSCGGSRVVSTNVW